MSKKLHSQVVFLKINEFKNCHSTMWTFPIGTKLYLSLEEEEREKKFREMVQV